MRNAENSYSSFEHLLKNCCNNHADIDMTFVKEYPVEWVNKDRLLSRNIIFANYFCRNDINPYICTDLVPGLITGIKREVSQNLTLSP